MGFNIVFHNVSGLGVSFSGLRVLSFTRYFVVSCSGLRFLLVSGKGCEPRHEKTNVLVSDLGRHKPGCTATDDG